MTPKEKAKELFDLMQLDWACDSCHNDWAKECALIAVDEILEVINQLDDSYSYNAGLFFNEVKQEINKL